MTDADDISSQRTDIYFRTMNSLLNHQHHNRGGGGGVYGGSSSSDTASNVYNSLPSFLQSSFTSDYRSAYQTANASATGTMCSSLSDEYVTPLQTGGAGGHHGHLENVPALPRTPSFAIHELLGLHGASRQMFSPVGGATDCCRYGSAPSNASHFASSTPSLHQGHGQGHVVTHGTGSVQPWLSSSTSSLSAAAPLSIRSSSSHPSLDGARSAHRSGAHHHIGIQDGGGIQRFTPHDPEMTSFNPAKNYHHGYVSQLGK